MASKTGAGGSAKVGISPWVPHIGTPLGLLGFYLLSHYRLLGPTPFWVLVLMMGTSAVLNLGATFLSAKWFPGMRGVNIRLAMAVIATTMIVYSTGWGAVIAIGYVLCVTDVLRSDGSQVWWRGLLWSIAGITVGQ